MSSATLTLPLLPPSSGIDYMLQAKLAEGRAREAEQKMGCEYYSAEDRLSKITM